MRTPLWHHSCDIFAHNPAVDKGGRVFMGLTKTAITSRGISTVIPFPSQFHQHVRNVSLVEGIDDVPL